MSASRKPAIGNRQSPVVWFLVISGVAFALRIIHLLQARHSDPLFFSPQMDALYHHEWALAIAAGKEFIADAYFRAPLYPYLLGIVYKLSGANQMAARIVQALIGSVGCGLVYILARQLLKPQASSPKPQASSRKPLKSDPHSSLLPLPSSLTPTIAGLVMAAYPLAIWYDGELLLEGTLTFLLMLGFVLLYRSRDKDRQWWLPGIVFGLASITRPNVLAFLAVLPVWLFVEGKGSKGPRVQGSKSETRALEPSNPGTRSTWTRLLLVWGAAALVILPVTIRNYVVSRQFVPIAWQAGTNFYIGNSPQSDGTTAILPGTRGSWWGGFDDVKRLAEQALGRPLKGAEIDRYWLGKGLEFWREQPGKALGLLARKTFLWFAGYEVGNETDLYAVKHDSFINYLLFNSGFLKFPFGILLPLALAGVWFRRKEWRRFLPLYLFVVAYSLSFIVFFVTGRYRTSVVPIVAILAAIGLIGLIRPIPAKTGTVPRAGRSEGLSPFSLRSGRGVAFLIFLAAFFLLNANIAGAGRVTRRDQSHFAVALGLHNQGRDAEALAEVRQALQVDSETNVLSFEASLLERQGDFVNAERSARAAVRLHPQESDAYGELGNVFAHAGVLDSAAHYFEVALQHDPYSMQAWINLGNVNVQRKDFEKARYYYEGALKIRPTFAEPMFYLGLCDYYEGKVAEAHARWQEVLKLDPSFTKARQALEQLK
ncbi:MAG TPA: tetratricopeptide repeat protein [bacterium]|nr:tetratricopeptide repeat protein [bacterium]